MVGREEGGQILLVGKSEGCCPLYIFLLGAESVRIGSIISRSLASIISGEMMDSAFRSGALLVHGCVVEDYIIFFAVAKVVH